MKHDNFDWEEWENETRNHRDAVGFTFGAILVAVAIATALVVCEFTGLTDAFINSF